jgi:hypothetical protein
VPTAIVIGDHDPVIRPDHIAHIAHAIPGARLIVLKDVGHPAHSQDPKQYLKAIEDFMAQISPAGEAQPLAAAKAPASITQSQAKAAPEAARPPVLPLPATDVAGQPSGSASRTAGLADGQEAVQ